MNNNRQNSLEEILAQVRLEERGPDYSALLRWLERFPEHRDALAEYFVAWALELELPKEDVALEEERLASKLVSHALDTLHKQREASAQVAPVQHGALRLIATARQQGMSARELAQRTRLDEDIILKLDLRRVRKVPRLCIYWLKTVLASTDSFFGEMVTGPPVLSSAVRHKAKGRPEPKTQDFVDTVRNSSLSDDDKQFWYDVAAADRTIGDEA